MQLAHGDLLVAVVEAVRDVPAQGPETPPLLQGVYMDGWTDYIFGQEQKQDTKLLVTAW